MNKHNKGVATVEACLVVPLFLFFMLAVVDLYGMLIAEAQIHQGLAEAAEYTAGYCYHLDRKSDGGSLETVGMLTARFQKYLGESQWISRCVSGGNMGIIISVKKDTTNKKIFYARADYVLRLHIPFLGNHGMKRQNVVKQKAFLGFDEEEPIDYYVYVTPNQEVYHVSRNCTHLELNVKKVSGTANRSPCRYCGRKKTGKYYIAEEGRVYHCNRNCSGLKRTVYRVKKSEVHGKGVCQRCGKK